MWDFLPVSAFGHPYLAAVPWICEFCGFRVNGGRYNDGYIVCCEESVVARAALESANIDEEWAKPEPATPPHEGCMDRACECVQAEVARLRESHRQVEGALDIAQAEVARVREVMERRGRMLDEKVAEVARVRRALGDHERDRALLERIARKLDA